MQSNSLIKKDVTKKIEQITNKTKETAFFEKIVSNESKSLATLKRFQTIKMRTPGLETLVTLERFSLIL